MKKRIVCFLLAMILVMGLIPNAVITANAFSVRETSDRAIDILRGSMTFHGKAEGGKVGYGTPDTYAGALNYINGITQEDAVDLMHDYIEDYVDVVINDWTKNNNVDLTQNEHDALAVHIYRTGANDGLYGAIRTIKTISSAADREAMVKAFVDTRRAYNMSSEEAMKPALDLSMAEAAMYLYGDYGYNGGSKLGYTLLDTDGDLDADDVIAYVKNDGYTLNPKGSDFLGWFLYDSKKEEITGAPLSKLTKDHHGKMVVAKQATPGANDPAKYSINTKTLKDLNVYNGSLVKTDVALANNTTFKVTLEFLDTDGVKWVYGSGTSTKGKAVSGWIRVGKLETVNPSTDKPIASATITANSVSVYPGATADGAPAITSLYKNDVVNVYEIKVEKTETGNKSWGKIAFEDGGNKYIGWINLANADVNETLGESGEAKGQSGKIANAENVNVRNSAGIATDNWIASLKKGTKVTVLETKMHDGAQWGLIKWSNPSNGYTQGWISMHYVQLDSAPTGSGTATPENVKYTGVVTSNINLNVRKSADVFSKKVDSLPNGTKINIYETKTKNNMKWGRIGENRWVCLAYVNLTKVDQPAAGTGTTTTSLQGTVTSASLNVLKNYNNNAEKVGTLSKGDVVTILEKNTEATGTGSRIWGRVSKNGIDGWINLAYVDLKTVTSVNGSTTGSSSSSATSNANGAAATIANCISVNVRESAGVSHKQIIKLNNGTPVKVYERVTKDSAPWARITWNNGANEGWVCMNYVTMNTQMGGTAADGTIGGTNSNTISATGIVNSNIDLKVRAGAGLGHAQIGSLKKGAKVTVYEQVSADGMIWGRTPYGAGSGWISMSYVTVESATSTGKGIMGTIARCYAAVNVRSAPGTNNALINKINVGSRVEVFETKQHGNMLWGRVAQGWICMDYVLLDSELPPGTVLDATVPTTEATKAPETDETINRDNEVGYTVNAKITTAGTSIDVRNDADDDTTRVGTVNNGLSVKILALKQNGAELWGRIDEYATAGWINMAETEYSVKGYVNTEDQPVYANADTSSTVKETLAINTELTISKLTVGGETVYGWVNNANGWIPMGRISDKMTDVIPTYKSSTDSFGADVTSGTTNTATDIVSEINGSKVVFKLKSGVKVYVGEIRIESGIVWGKLTANGVTGWINMAKVNYQLYNCNVVAGNMNVRSSKVVMDEDAEPNNILGTISGGLNTLCELSFDGEGNLWGKVTMYTDLSGAAVNNGGYVMVKPAGGSAYITNTGITY